MLTQPHQISPSDAWAQRAVEHGHAVLVALLAKGLSFADAQDASQAAWERILRKARAGELAVLELPGLIIQQAMFLHLSRARSDLRAPPNPRQGADAEPAPDERAIAAQALGRLEDCLRRERPQVKRIFQLAYGEASLSHEEIAREVGLSTQRVRQVLCEVRATLRARLEEP